MFIIYNSLPLQATYRENSSLAYGIRIYIVPFEVQYWKCGKQHDPFIAALRFIGLNYNMCRAGN